MPRVFPPTPDRHALRFESGRTVARVAEPSDAAVVVEIIVDPPGNDPEHDQGRSSDRVRLDLETLDAAAGARAPATNLYWIVEHEGSAVGVVSANLRYLDNAGGSTGPRLRSAVWLVHFKPAALNGDVLTVLERDIAPGLERALVEHFGVEQLVFWAADDDAVLRGLAAASGFEGPVNHDHPQGLGLYRRPPRR